MARKFPQRCAHTATGVRSLRGSGGSGGSPTAKARDKRSPASREGLHAKVEMIRAWSVVDKGEGEQRLAKSACAWVPFVKAFSADWVINTQ